MSGILNFLKYLIDLLKTDYKIFIIACLLLLCGYFIYKDYKNDNTDCSKQVIAIEEKCSEREEKLQQEVRNYLIEMITIYKNKVESEEQLNNELDLAISKNKEIINQLDEN